MYVSGTTAIGTSGDSAVNLIGPISGVNRDLYIINEGGVAGFFSIDGTNWARISAGPGAIGPIRLKNAQAVTVQVKRVAGTVDMSGLWAFTN